MAGINAGVASNFILAGCIIYYFLDRIVSNSFYFNIFDFCALIIRLDLKLGL